MTSMGGDGVDRGEREKKKERGRDAAKLVDYPLCSQAVASRVGSAGRPRLIFSFPRDCRPWLLAPLLVLRGLCGGSVLFSTPGRCVAQFHER